MTNNSSLTQESEKKEANRIKKYFFFLNRIHDRFEWHFRVEEEDDIIGNTLRDSI